MRIERLPEGERARDDVDCIHIAAAGGEFYLTGSALRRGTGTDEPESDAIIGGRPYNTAAAAEDAGVAWAADRGVELLYVSRA